MDTTLPHKNLIIRNDFERIVMGEVYVPMHLDTFHTTMTKEEIKRVAYDFMRKGLLDHIDIMHDYKKSGCYVVESFIARAGDPDFVEGSWVLATKIVDDSLWQRVLNGEFNGYSIGGRATREAALVNLTRLKEIELRTQPSINSDIEEHTHVIHAFFDDEGNLIPTWTSKDVGHEHRVLSATATEIELNHNHRYVVVE